MNELPKDHNHPPEMIELAKEVTRQLSAWLAENPAVSTEKDARDIKLQIDRAKLCLKDLEAERDGKVRPLNDKVDMINAAYRPVRRPLGTVLDTMLGALDAFTKAEEAHRVAIAMEARRKADEAEQKARKAEELERDRLESIRMGEVGLDLSRVVEEADEAFDLYEKAQREAIRAQAATHVKIAGGLSRAISIKEKVILEIEDPMAFIAHIGLPENVKLAMKAAARVYHRANGQYPAGVTVRIERHV